MALACALSRGGPELPGRRSVGCDEIVGKGATGSRRDKAVQLQLGQWLTVSVSPFTDEKGQICTLKH